MTTATKTRKAAGPGVYIPSREATKILQRSAKTLRLLAERGVIRTHQPPGCRATYHLQDVLEHAPKS